MNDSNKPTPEQVDDMERAEVLDAAAMGESNPNIRIGMIAAGFAAVREETIRELINDETGEMLADNYVGMELRVAEDRIRQEIKQDLLSPGPCGKHPKFYSKEIGKDGLPKTVICSACEREKPLVDALRKCAKYAENCQLDIEKKYFNKAMGEYENGYLVAVVIFGLIERVARAALKPWEGK